MIFDAGSPVSDPTISVEGNLYFTTSTTLYAIKPDGTPYAPAQLVAPVTGPALDDRNGYVYLGQATVQGWNLVRYTKQLQNPQVVYSGTALPGSLIIGNDGTVYFFVSGTAVAVGARNWSVPVCGQFIGSPALGENGDVYGMCTGDGLYRLDGTTGGSVIHKSYFYASHEPMIDSQGKLHSGFERTQFGGVVFVSWGDYSTWDSDLNLISDDSDFTNSRASLMPDGSSTVRIGAADYLGENNLSLRGPTSWDLSAGMFNAFGFTTVPTVDAAGKIYVGLDNGLVCVNASDHSTVWQFNVGESVVTQPVIASTGVYVATSSGKIYVF